MIDCNKCENRGKINGLSQDSFCDSCIHSGINWKKDHYLCKKTHLERINALPDVFMLASLVQFKYVQDISEPNNTNFKVSMAGGHYTFGKPEHYDKFMDKYLTWLESRK